MITEQHIIEKMRQAMQRIDQTTGAAQKEQIAAMKVYCELLLESESTPSSTVSLPTSTPQATPAVDPMLARFMGVAQEKEEKGTSLLDF
ncbi:hypothetical protein ADM98_04270 [Exiguobacterium sp. BMC-KP]|uniref:DUF5327 family protein n=1 Tax=Exiguobacterium sp. BMC-KP TaxID=1684312 RepID=UPI0006AA5516|nr:DUF5327 family protein [Exiguobacterium sp. BMC-KP]KOP30676.1 hypothetical protein ADM98_04270 [Exiguobacterium sp. BMC-KP]